MRNRKAKAPALSNELGKEVRLDIAHSGEAPAYDMLFQASVAEAVEIVSIRHAQRLDFKALYCGKHPFDAAAVHWTVVDEDPPVAMGFQMPDRSGRVLFIARIDIASIVRRLLADIDDRKAAFRKDP